MEKPELVLIVGGVGLALNALVMSFLHGETLSPSVPCSVD